MERRGKKAGGEAKIKTKLKNQELLLSFQVWLLFQGYEKRTTFKKGGKTTKSKQTT